MSNVSRKPLDPGIGRLLVASLHEAIANLMPMRLDFYEHWLRPEELHQGTIGRAPLSAVLGFLRTEPAYHRLVEYAGGCAADWALADLGKTTTRLARALPLPIAVRLALMAAGRLVRHTHRASRARVGLRRRAGTVEIGESVFCDVREQASRPLCGYYAAAVARTLRRPGIDADVRTDECRGAGGARCALALEIRGRAAGEAPALEALSRAEDVRPAL